MRADVNTSKRSIRDAMAAGCGPSPLCVPCGFRDKPVPSAWKTSMPGTPYPCDDPAIGSEVVLRGDSAPSVVVGCATPVGPSLLQLGRVSQRRQCEGALLVRTPLGIVTPVTRSVVRERKRRTSKPGRATCYCAGVAHPHREGSTPLCEKHPDNLGELVALSRDAYEGGERDEVRFIASASRAAKGRAKVETVDDANAFVHALEARQVEDYQKSEARRMEPRKVYKARLAKAKAEARRMGWAV